MVNTTFEKFLLELSRRVYEDPKLQRLGNALGLREFEIGSIKYDKLSRDGNTQTDSLFSYTQLKP